MSTRILVVIPYPIPFPPYSGGQRAIFFALKHLSNSELVYTYTLNENKFDFVEKNYNEMSASKWRYANLYMPIRLLQIIKEQGIEVIQFEHPYLAGAMLFLRLFSKVKISLRTHNIEHDRFRKLGKKWWRLLWLYEKLAFRCAHIVYFITKEDKALACKTLNDCRKNNPIIYYGVDIRELPNRRCFDDAKKYVQSAHALEQQKIILFNGSLSYFPNELAVKEIIREINPLLRNQESNYKILICGKGLRNELQQEIEQIDEVIYTGFVEDIDIYFKASDVFINPVIEGGGVKTKLIEALGFGKSCVSYASGSHGVDSATNRLNIINDHDVKQFVEAVSLVLSKPIDDDNKSFYDHYYWKNVVAKIVQAQNELLNK